MKTSDPKKRAKPGGPFKFYEEKGVMYVQPAPRKQKPPPPDLSDLGDAKW